MSKERQFENIENKIKTTLESGEYAFNDQAWAKMEALLDKEDKKRRPIPWLWLLPVLLIGIAVLIKFTGSKTTESSLNESSSHVKKEDKSAESTSQSKSEQENKTSNITSSESNEKTDKRISAPANKTNITEGVAASLTKNNFSSDDKKKTQLKPLSGVNSISEGSTVVGNSKQGKSKRGKIHADNNTDLVTGAINKTGYQEQANSSSQKNKSTAPGNVAIQTTSSVAENIDSDTITSMVVTTAVNDSLSGQQQSVLKKVNEKTQSTNNGTVKNKETASSKFSSKFYLLGSLGADAGSVKLLSSKNTTIVARYGLGVGYQFSKKLSVQTGFFISNKKYSAGPGDYHVKAGSYWDMYKITSVDAVCKIYDIPLSIRYDLANKGSMRYYVMAGISSYIMKKEDYDYFYLRWGTPAEKSYGYTGNSHLFSNANLSFGIEKKMSKAFSLQLEPSLSVPVKGVGDGKVKLYSTSLILGLKYLPFKK